jgi:DNA modification methylase
MDGEKADLWLTDPPYGVSYKSNGAEDKHEKIANDDLPLKEMYEFWKLAASNALIVSSDKCAYYWFACQGGDQMMMMMMMSIGDANWKVRHELIWVKDSLVMGRCDYHYKHEPILYGWKKDGTHEWQSDRKQTSVLEFPRPKRSEEHPTMKPVELVEYLMGNSSKPGQIVLDTFGGSGTTLIAAEKSGRSARLMELSPKYCDVIIKRWEQFTGKQAELLNESPT